MQRLPLRLTGTPAVTTAVLHPTRFLLAYNKSSGYRWSPIPKPPPPHYDRLYGVHAVLNALRVAATRQLRAPDEGAMTSSSLFVAVEHLHKAPPPHTPDLHGASVVEKILCSSPKLCASAEAGAGAAVTSSGSHPHRPHLSCLYVRDFSLEEDGRGATGRASHGDSRHSSSGTQRRKKVIPPRYIAVHCIVALAKSLEVPVRFVPRSELVQLCGERRHQNVVLEASSYVPGAVQRLGDIWSASPDTLSETGRENGVSGACAEAAAAHPTQLVLFLEHIIDPTNIGSILRTAFFFGVDHVVLSRDCAACTSTVSRTSTGFLEHLRVYRAAVPTAEFLRASWEAAPGSVAGEATPLAPSTSSPPHHYRLEVIASAVVVPTSPDKESCPTQRPVNAEDNAGEPTPSVAARHLRSSSLNVRVLLLGNEDAGLPLELLKWCSHVAHVRSPRQARLRQARHGNRDVRPPLRKDGDACDEDDSVLPTEGSSTDASQASPSSHATSQVEKRQHSLQRLARLRAKEVSLNVNCATAALLTSLVAVGDAPLSNESLGMVEVRPLGKVSSP